MPPVPLHSSYPPSGLGYRPLATDEEQGTQSSHGGVRQRTFLTSPSRATANDPSQLLRAFLTETRSSDDQAARKVSLRVQFHHPARDSVVVELPVARLTPQDALPFALADDVPCRRGARRAPTWRKRLRNLADELTGNTTPPSEGFGIDDSELQVWDRSQGKALPASDEQVQRYRRRLERGTVPPWKLLNDEHNASDHDQATVEGDDVDMEDESVDWKKLLGGKGDLDLGIFFRRSRRRASSRLVSVALQEALERFADDRHLSKHLVCRNVAWGWDLPRLRDALRALAAEATEDKGKAPATSPLQGYDVEVEVIGLGHAPVYHVVWKPIALLTIHCPRAVESRTATLSLVALTLVLTAAILLGWLGGRWAFLAMVVVVTWGGLMGLVRSRRECVYDGIGTAWSLAPRWQPLEAENDWDEDRVRASLAPASDGDRQHIELRGDVWCLRRGIDPDEWLDLHRERILHALTIRST